MKKHVFIAIVSYAMEIEARVWTSLLGVMGPLSELGWNTTIRVRTNDADLARARNAMVADFLSTDATDLFFLDADVSWEPGAMERLLVRRGVDMVAGIYPQRVDDGTFPVRWLVDQDKKGIFSYDPVSGEVSENGVIEVAGVPAGFLRLTRKCCEMMTKANEDRWYYEGSLKSGKAVSLFEFRVHDDHHRWSEDLTFCRRWRELGGKVWLDPNMTLHHHGAKTYTGNIGHSLRNRAQSQEEIAQACEEHRAIEANDAQHGIFANRDPHGVKVAA